MLDLRSNNTLDIIRLDIIDIIFKDGNEISPIYNNEIFFIL